MVQTFTTTGNTWVVLEPIKEELEVQYIALTSNSTTGYCDACYAVTQHDNEEAYKAHLLTLGIDLDAPEEPIYDINE